jgi:hypothetical protein
LRAAQPNRRSKPIRQSLYGAGIALALSLAVPSVGITQAPPYTNSPQSGTGNPLRVAGPSFGITQAPRYGGSPQSGNPLAVAVPSVGATQAPRYGSSPQRGTGNPLAAALDGLLNIDRSKRRHATEDLSYNRPDLSSEAGVHSSNRSHHTGRVSLSSDPKHVLGDAGSLQSGPDWFLLRDPDPSTLGAAAKRSPLGPDQVRDPSAIELQK